MAKDSFGQFQRQSPEEIRQRRVLSDRFIPFYLSCLLIEIALSAIFPIVDLVDYLPRKTGAALRASMHLSLEYALLSCTVLGAVVLLISLFRLHAIKKNPKLKGHKLCRAGLYITAGLLLILIGAWSIT